MVAATHALHIHKVSFILVRLLCAAREKNSTLPTPPGDQLILDRTRGQPPCTTRP
jgi:hypothetical protein